MKKYAIGLLIVGVLAVLALVLAIFRPTVTQIGYTGSQFEHGIYIPSRGALTVEGSTVLSGTNTFSGATNVTGALTSVAFTQGGGVRATSTVGAVVPLLASDFDTENVIDVTLNVLDATLSFPATTTLTSFVPTSGQMRTLFIRNASTTAAMDLTISGGTGVLMKQATSTGVTIPGDTDGANYARIQLLRKANTDIEMLVEVFKD